MRRWKKCIAALMAATLVFGVSPTARAGSETVRAEVVCVGDLLCLGGQLSAAKTRSGYDFDYVFSGVRKLISGADLAMGNLETPAAGPKGGYTRTGQTGFPILNAPYSYLKAVKSAGFDLVTTANNHAADKGERGIRTTLKNIRRAGMTATGTFASKRAKRYAVKNVNGIRVGVLAYNEGGYNRKQYSLSAEKRSYMLNTYSYARAKADIRRLRREGRADVVIAAVHWGEENTHSVTGGQKRIARQLAAAGADVVVGSHPHVLQKFQYLKGKSGKKTLVAYSLGNFVSSMPRPENRDAVILRLRLTKRDGETGVKAEYLPVRTGSRWKIRAPKSLSAKEKAGIRKVTGKAVKMILQ